METKSIKISLTEKAIQVLKAYNIAPEDYGPAYGGESVGLDLYNCGEDISIPSLKKWHVFDEPVVLVPTGVKISIPEGYVAFIKERSSIVKTPMTVRAGVIDPGYTGEIFVNFSNIGNRDVNIPFGAKIPAQLVVLRCETQYNVVSNLEFLKTTEHSKRKEGSVGSTENNTQSLKEKGTGEKE